MSTVSALPERVLSTRDAVALVVGIVIGAGIFKFPSLVAGMAGSQTMVYALWLAGGLVSIVGALCYAELATAFPNAGGDYHFLTRAFGRHLSFLFACLYSCFSINLCLFDNVSLNHIFACLYSSFSIYGYVF